MKAKYKPRIRAIRSLAPVALLLLSSTASTAADNFLSTDARELAAIGNSSTLREEDFASESRRMNLIINQIQVETARDYQLQTRAENVIRNSIYARQLLYDPIIMVSVLLIVFAGVALSYLHVRRTLPGGAADPTTLEVGKGGLKINSPVIGLVILFISLGFFYLYLTEVYRVKDVCSVATDSSAALPKDAATVKH